MTIALLAAFLAAQPRAPRRPRRQREGQRVGGGQAQGRDSRRGRRWSGLQSAKSTASADAWLPRIGVWTSCGRVRQAGVPMTYRQRMRAAAMFKCGNSLIYVAGQMSAAQYEVDAEIRAVLVAVDRTGRAPREYTRALEVLERKDERARRRAK